MLALRTPEAPPVAPTVPFNGEGLPAAPTPLPADGWELVAPGLERRIYQPLPNNALAQLVALRIDPALYTFRVHYRPGDPLALRGWRDALPGAAAFVNANYFDPAYQALGLVVADGAAYGQSFTDRGGLFQVQGSVPRVRSILNEPYWGEALEQAAQAFPMLVANGQAAYTNPYDGDTSRRTAVGQDANGRILLFVTPLVGLTLPELSAFLTTSDMGLVNAMNLDGGGSTMMYISVGAQPFQVRSFDAVPTVIAAYPR
jgi:hypothetical protein